MATTPFPYKIISGGQTGADRAGLDFAIAAGLEHGGHCPAGRRCEDGEIPPQYNMIETPDWRYRTRTILNVQNADVTIVFNAGTVISPGSGLTLSACKSHQKPVLLLKGFDLQASPVEQHAMDILAFLARHRPAVMNIAGNREVTTPGIAAHVVGALRRVRELALTGPVVAAAPPATEAPLPVSATPVQGRLFL